MPGLAWLAWPGLAGLGLAGLGLAGLGLAWPALAWPGLGLALAWPKRNELMKIRNLPQTTIGFPLICKKPMWAHRNIGIS